MMIRDDHQERIMRVHLRSVVMGEEDRFRRTRGKASIMHLDANPCPARRPALSTREYSRYSNLAKPVDEN